MRRSTTFLLALPLTLLLAGCSVVVDGAAPEAPVATESERSQDEDAPAVGDDPADADEPATGAGDCTGDEVAAMDGAVDGQLDAIVARDWEGALGFATTGFRSQYDAPAFEETILDGFPVVAAATGHTSEGCVRDGDDAQLLVTVTADDGRTAVLVYLMAREEGSWRIGGAVPHDVGDEQDTTTV